MRFAPLLTFALALLFSPVTAQAQGEDIITPHITDSHHIDYPCPSVKEGFVCEVELPHWTPLKIGSVELDLSPTKHVVMLLIASTLVCLILIAGARSQRRSALVGKPPTGFANGIEALVLYMRNEVIMPNLGHGGEKYVPFCLTIFFFILSANLLGLIPYMSTATGNISVTATLAIITFFVVEFAGMKALGKGYIGTVVYWPHDMPLAIKAPMTLIMTPVEIIGKLTKPFAFTMRLFANMMAGHIVVLVFLGMIFLLGSYVMGLVPLAMVVVIMFLELFVAFLQAFIFTLLSSVFIGQIRQHAH